MVGKNATGKSKLASKKTALDKLRKVLMEDDLDIWDVVELIGEKEKSIKAKAQKNDKLGTIPENDVLKTPIPPKEDLKIPIPSAKPSDYEDPFPSSEEEEAESDILNQARSFNYSTDRSMVTVEDQDKIIKKDPFKDGNKKLGPRLGNPYSTAPMTMRKADPIKLYSEVMVEGLNKKSYVEKLELRRKDSLVQKLNGNLDITTQRDVETDEKRRLNDEYKRYAIDAKRREEKIPEPNMIDSSNGECSDAWKQWFERRLNQIKEWLIEDAISGLPPSKECEPPMGVSLLAADWNVFKKHEINVEWNYEKYGPMVLSDNMAYDGKNLYNPLNGRVWDNIIEHLEHEVKKSYLEIFPGSDYDVFDDNNGYFWSLILQQWYDIINVSNRQSYLPFHLIIIQIIFKSS